MVNNFSAIKTLYIYMAFLFFYNCENNNKQNIISPIIWESNYRTTEFEKSFPVYWSADTSIYFSRDSYMTSFNAQTGAEKWRYQFNYTAANILERTYIDKDYIYSAAADEILVLNHRGNKVFQSFGYVAGHGESYLDGSNFYYLKESELKRYNIELNIEENVLSRPTNHSNIIRFTIDGNIIYLSCTGKERETKEGAIGGIYAIDLSTKELVWKFEVEPEPFNDKWLLAGFSHSSLIYDNILFNSTNSGTEGILTAYGLNKNTGEKLWELEPIPISQRPAMIDHIILAFTHNSLTAIDIRNGNILWKNELGHAALAHTYAYKGYFYFVYNEIMVYEPQTGKKLYTYNLHHGISRKSLGFGDDKIFVNGYDRLYALKAYHVLK